MAYDAVDIASYVVNYCIGINKPISNLKLQKIMYYLQAAFLVDTGDSLFHEDIMAWKYGPVIEEVYQKFKYYLDRDIVDEIRTKKDFQSFRIENGRIKVDTVDYDPGADIQDQDKERIHRVVDALVDKSPFDLVDCTHEEKPWLSTDLNSAIDIDLIKDYFSDHEDRIYGK